jgi:CMP-N-acetylneuraminic acid synthetase
MMGKVTAIIPARGGSKGIVNKNISILGGRPLIYYALEACKKTKEIGTIVVTTDSNLIESTVLEKYPDTVIIRRPDKLSNDSATSEDALLHAIKVLDSQSSNLDKILFVQATSPLTLSRDLSQLIYMLEKHDSAAFYTEDYGFFFDLDDLHNPRLPRQQREPRKREAGNAWAFSKKGFLKHKTRLFGDIALCKLDYPSELEIDTPSDLSVIESIMNVNSIS